MQAEQPTNSAMDCEQLSYMVNREDRQKACKLIEGLANAEIRNDDFDSGFPRRSRDRSSPTELQYIHPEYQLGISRVSLAPD